MKICDRHHRLSGETVLAADKVIFQSTSEEFDLCLTCSDEVREFIQQSKKLQGEYIKVDKPSTETIQKETIKDGPKRVSFFARKNKE